MPAESGQETESEWFAGGLCLRQNMTAFPALQGVTQ